MGADDVSQLVLLLDVNPFFWGVEADRSNGSVGVTFDQYFQHVSSILRSVEQSIRVLCKT